jgi:hypothetical protein
MIVKEKLENLLEHMTLKFNLSPRYPTWQLTKMKMTKGNELSSEKFDFLYYSKREYLKKFSQKQFEIINCYIDRELVKNLGYELIT